MTLLIGLLPVSLEKRSDTDCQLNLEKRRCLITARGKQHWIWINNGIGKPKHEDRIALIGKDGGAMV